MRSDVVGVLSAALLASGCIVISKTETLTPDEQAARKQKQQQSAQEVGRMASSTYRVQAMIRDSRESRPDSAGAGIPSRSE